MKKILVILFFPIICFADWNSVSINSSWDLNAIHFADENIGYAVGLDGLVIKSTDGGSNWISLGNIIWNGSVLNRNIIDVYFFNPDTGFILVQGEDTQPPFYDAMVLRTDDGGLNWFTQMGFNLNPINGFAVASSFSKVNDYNFPSLLNNLYVNFNDYDKPYIGEKDITNNVSTQHYPSPYTLTNKLHDSYIHPFNHPQGNKLLYYAGTNMFARNSSWGHWLSMSQLWGGTSCNFNSINRVGNDLVLVGDYGLIIKTNFNINDPQYMFTLADFTLVNPPSDTTLNDIEVINDIAYVVGEYGVVKKSIDNGNTWVSNSLSTSYHLNDIFMLNECNGWIVGNHGTLYKFFNPPVIQNVTSCSNYFWNGINYTSSGTYYHADTLASGCDSITILNLMINNIDSSSTTISACDNFDANGQIYYTSGNYSFLTSTVNGCDSTVNLNLTINNSYSSYTGYSSCDPFVWQGLTINNSGIYTNSYTTIAGCDSIFSIDVNIGNNESTETIVSCESYNWNGNNYYSSGNYTWTGTNILGCDSIANLNLTINTTSNSSEVITACDYYNFNGTTYNSSGNYTWIGSNTFGCDSIVALDLTIDNSISNIYQSGDSLYSSLNSSNVPYTTDWYNIHPSTGQYWLMKTNSESFNPKFDCHYFIITTTENGCIDTSSTYYFGQFANEIQTLEVKPNPTSGKLVVDFINERSQFVKLRLVNNLGNQVAEFTTKELQMDIDLSSYPSGVYYLFFTSEKETLTTKIILNK